MRNFLCLLTIILIGQFSSQAQITVDAAYNGKVLPVLLESAGTKYATFDSDNFQLKLYNIDHSIYKTITISNPTVSLYDTSVYNSPFTTIYFNYVKEGLFDTDSEVEFMLYYLAYGGGSTSLPLVGTAIINEDGSVLFKKENMIPVGNSVYQLTDLQTIVNTSANGSKMILTNLSSGPGINIDSSVIYNLPGTLECDPCGGITGARSTERSNNIVLDQNYPNPSSTYTVIGYQLPEESNTGTLKIYNTAGIELKSYQIDKTFNDLQISTQELPAGTYYYTIQTNNGQVKSKKMVVVK